MSYKDTQVYQYLKYLEAYLVGDINTFHEVCEACERKENTEKKESSKTAITSSLGEGLKDTISTESSTTTTYTTVMPEANHSTSGGNVFDIDTLPKYFRTTIPNTLTLFSTVDLVGFLIGKGAEGDTTGNFNQFFDGQGIIVEEMNVLIKVFRHGMTHGYFPKLNLGISYHTSNAGKKMFFNENGNLILNVNQLEDVVLNRLSEIMENESLYANMENQYQKLIGNYEKKVRPDIEALSKLIG